MMDSARFLVIAGLTLLILVAAWSAATGDGARERIVKRALAALRKKPGGRRRDIPSLKLNPNATRLDKFASRILPNPEYWQRQLERTGTGWSLGVFVAFAVAIALGIGVSAWALHLPLIARFAAGIAAGFFAPRMLVGWAIGKRCRKFLANFPDAIGLMVRGVRSGLPITDTIINVGREVGGPVGEEFRKISDQIQLGQALEEVMWQAAGRIELAEFTFMCITFGIQRETGGNLAETLDNLEQLLRRRKQMRLKIRAFSSEARASSTIIGSLPFIMLALLTAINFDYIETLFTTRTGNILLGAAGLSLALGVAALAKLGNFEI